MENGVLSINNVYIAEKSDKAFLLLLGKRFVWIPKSQLKEEYHSLEKRSIHSMDIPIWLLKKNRIYNELIENGDDNKQKKRILFNLLKESKDVVASIYSVVIDINGETGNSDFIHEIEAYVSILNKTNREIRDKLDIPYEKEYPVHTHKGIKKTKVSEWTESYE